MQGHGGGGRAGGRGPRSGNLIKSTRNRFGFDYGRKSPFGRNAGRRPTTVHDGRHRVAAKSTGDDGDPCSRGTGLAHKRHAAAVRHLVGRRPGRIRDGARVRTRRGRVPRARHIMDLPVRPSYRTRPSPSRPLPPPFDRIIIDRTPPVAAAAAAATALRCYTHAPTTTTGRARATPHTLAFISPR